MFIAIDNNMNRVHIDDSLIRQEYLCPYCESPLIIRKGEIRRHHFSHKPGAVCKDSWQSEYDMSDWHADWQNCYPKENQEIPCQLGEIRHRADILVDRSVIEFQHSSLSASNFSKRNHFYHDLGYKVIWVFDVTDLYESNQLFCREDEKGLHFTWIRPRNTFQDSDILSGHIEVFLQLTKDDAHCLVRIDKLSKSGIEHFTALKWYSKEVFLEYTGLHNGICAPPYHEDDTVNEQYHSFCKQYHIQLNPQQERAVQAIDGANLLLAVPGSGKTTVLVVRLGYMILCRGIDPSSILSITYTRAAAFDMKTRFAKLFGGELSEKLRFQTINSLSAGIIKYYEYTKHTTAFQLIDDKQRRTLLHDIYRKLTGEYPTENDLIAAETVITRVKNMMLTDDSDIESIETEVPSILKYYKMYLNAMNSAHLMDYDDQMRYALGIFKKCPDILSAFQERYHYICVDEAQDTSKLQHTLIRKLSEKYNNIFMVGDEDQSIYGFRAAYPQALMSFRNDYRNPFILYMERNYRSTVEIVNAAQRFIEHNRNRHPKHMVADRGNGDAIDFIPVKTRTEQYFFLLKTLKEDHGEIAVLYRDNECAIPLIDLLMRGNLPYYTPKNQMIFFSSRPILDIICFLRLIVDPYNTEAFMQIYYKCNLGINKKTAVYACNKSKWNSIPVTDALLKTSSELTSAKGKPEQFVRNLSYAAKQPTVRAIQSIYDSMYKQYLIKNHMDSSKIEILLAIAANESNIGEFLNRFDKLPKMIEENSHKTKDAVVLSTVHSSKGQEYDTVFIMDVFDGYLPKAISNEWENNPEKEEAYQEERRLFYVAMTRAKNRLHLFGITSRYSTFTDEVFPHISTRTRSEANGVSVVIHDKEATHGHSKALTKETHFLDDIRSRKTSKLIINNIALYQVGTIVHHRLFGTGSITQVDVFGESGHIIEVDFRSGGVRKLQLEMLLGSRMFSIVSLPNNENDVKQNDEIEPIKTKKQIQYELGLADVKDLFTQQTTIIRDRFGNRWVKCEICGIIKQDVEFASYGGTNHINLGTCRECCRR